MPRLLGPTDLGGLPSARTGRQIATYDVSPIAEGVRALGQAVSVAGGVLQARQNELDKYDTERKYQQFTFDQAKAEDEAKQSMQPGAAGYADAILAKRQADAEKFITENVPKHLQDQYRVRELEGARAAFLRSAEAQHTEQARAAVSGFHDTVNSTVAPVASAAGAANDTEGWQAARAKVDALAKDNPGFTPITRDINTRAAQKVVDQAFLENLPPDEFKRRLAEARGAGGVTGPGGPGFSENLVNHLKNPGVEGYDPKAFWDVHQFTSGHGTKARPGDSGPISLAEADRRLREEMVPVAKFVNGLPGADKLNQNQREAIMSVAFNVGEGNIGTGLKDAIAAGDGPAIAAMLDKYRKVDDPKLAAGVSARRDKDIAFFNAPVGGAGASAAATSPFAHFTPDELRILEGRAEADQSKASTAEHGNVSLAIVKGEITDPQQILDNPILRPADKASLINTWQAKNKDQLDTAAAFAAANTPGFTWNRFEEKHNKMADLLFKAQGGDINAFESTVGITGIVPPSGMKALRGAVVSGDPAKAAAALSVATNLIAKNGSIFDGVDGGQDVEKASIDFSHYVDHFGMTPDQAAKRVIESRTPEYKAKVAVKVKGEDLDKIIKDNLTTADISKNLDTSWFGDPQVENNPKAREAILSDYAEIFKDAYLQSGDIDQAKKQALASLNKVWGLTFVGGQHAGVVTRWPVELAPAYRGIPNAAERIGKDASAAVKAYSGEDVPVDKIVLTPLGQGQTSQPYVSGQDVPYSVSYQDKNGHWQVLPPGKAYKPDAKAMAADVAKEEDAAAQKVERENLMRAGNKAAVDKAVSDAVAGLPPGAPPIMRQGAAGRARLSTLQDQAKTAADAAAASAPATPHVATFGGRVGNPGRRMVKGIPDIGGGDANR